MSRLSSYARHASAKLAPRGQMIEYVHFHVIPRHTGDRVSFYELGPRHTPEQLAAMAGKIETALQQRCLRFHLVSKRLYVPPEITLKY